MVSVHRFLGGFIKYIKKINAAKVCTFIKLAKIRHYINDNKYLSNMHIYKGSRINLFYSNSRGNGTWACLLTDAA